MPPLLADVDFATVGLSGVIGAGGAAVVWLVKELKDWRATRRKENKEDEAGTIEEYRELLEREKESNREEQSRCDQRIGALERRIDARDRRLRVMTLAALTLIGWVRYAVAVSADGKVPVPPKGLDDLEAMIKDAKDEFATPVPAEAPKTP